MMSQKFALKVFNSIVDATLLWYLVSLFYLFFSVPELRYLLILHTALLSTLLAVLLYIKESNNS